MNNECTRKDECLRHLAAEHVPQGVTSWRCLLPQTATGDEHCKGFCQLKTEQRAYGLSPLFDHVEKKDYAVLKAQVEAYLGGHSNYYRYHRGERQLCCNVLMLYGDVSFILCERVRNGSVQGSVCP